MVQRAQPIVDLAEGIWKPTPIYPNINALNFTSDAGAVTAGNPQGDYFIVALRPISSPPPGRGPQTLFVRAMSTAANATMTALLMQNGLVIAIRDVPLGGAFQTNAFPLSAVEIGMITNYSQLQVEIIVGMPLVGGGSQFPGCNQLPNGGARFFSFIVTGVTNGTCNDCTKLNRPSVLVYQGSCQWLGAAFFCTIPQAGAYFFAYDQPTSSWLLQFDTGSVKWTAPAAGWDGQSPLTLSVSAIEPNPNCANLPSQITLTPINSTGGSSSSSSSSGPGQVQVSWIQFQAPDHVGSTSTSTVPVGGGTGAGCGCGCSCAGCNTPEPLPMLGPGPAPPPLFGPPGIGLPPINDRLGPPPPDPKPPSISKAPIRYATGEIYLPATDLHSNGGGFPWGHTRSFASRLSENTNAGNGYNWRVKDWPYLVMQDSGTVVVMGAANAALWFDPSGSGYLPRFNVRQTLTFDAANNVYNLYELDGSITQFDGGSGVFLNHTDAGGNTIAPVGYTANGFNFTEVQRTTTVGTTTAVESFIYEYVDATADYPVLSSVTLRRSVNAGAWTYVTTAAYTYYADGDPNGGTNDLQTVETSTWGDGEWVTTGTTLYRYWLSTGSSSSSSNSSSSSSDSSSSSSWGPSWSSHRLKYVVLPASYNRLAADPNVSNPLTAPDSIVAQYADNYFAYDSEGRVTSESVNGGTTTFTYAYAQSGNPNGFDSWATKTVETQPDGSQNIIYANYAGQTMLQVLQSGSDQWCNYYQYDTAIADMILHAMPSAVTGFDEAYADLVNGGAYLNSNAGLIQLYQYHAPTGYLSAESIQQGTFGTPILLRQYEYVACTPTPSSSSSSLSSSNSPSSSSSCACAPVPVYFLAAVIQYPSDGQLSSSSSSSSGPLPQIFTTYSYTWYPGTCQVQQRITTLPVISTAQNGSGVANTRGEYYDIYGNRTWQMDERGILTRTTYDIPTDGITERIDDVDTTQVSDAPPGWTTPAGAGQHLITDMSIDSQGRTTQVLGPSHTIALNGTATVIRRARWLVYQDATQQVWLAAGYATVPPRITPARSKTRCRSPSMTMPAGRYNRSRRSAPAPMERCSQRIASRNQRIRAGR